MNYAEHTEIKNIILEDVKDIIRIDNLDSSRTSDEHSHKRFYLMHTLRLNSTLSLIGIGKLFNRDHSTIIHGIKKHKDYVDHYDKVYLDNILNVKSYLKGKYPKMRE